MKGTLVVLRGNSGSGKSTAARRIQEQHDRAQCLVVGQDQVRRTMLRERDVAGGANIDLLESIAEWGLDRGLLVVTDGIFNAGRYQRMLQRVAGRASLARFFAWDLSFDETVARHAHRADRVDFTTDEMADWYHGWQPLDFVDEERFDASVSIEDAVARVEVAIGTRAQR